jgi:hypothetical protein
MKFQHPAAICRAESQSRHLTYINLVVLVRNAALHVDMEGKIQIAVSGQHTHTMFISYPHTHHHPLHLIGSVSK